MATNLPPRNLNDSAAGTKLFFDSYGKSPLEFSATDVDAAVNFFRKNGFDEDASLVTATTLLKQAKLERISIFEILDQIKNLEQIQISALVGEILNNNRVPSSTLGYKTTLPQVSKTRNIFP